MAKQLFDVVIVSDFSGPASYRFEILTLFFLASWLEFGGDSGDLPLHIVCIGEPPESVRILGGRCGARLTSHDSLLFGGFANKLRGFEVCKETDHILLMDSDMLVLSDISNLPTALGIDCIAAATANGPGPSSKRWRELHEAMGLPYPEDHTVPLNLELDTYKCARYRKRNRNDLAPYYNSGVIYAPWASGLGDVWRDHLIRISKIGPTILGPKIQISNQPSLATAIHELQLGGANFRLLPDEYHTRWQHVGAGTVPSREVKLFHTIGFGRWRSPTDVSSAKQDIDVFRRATLEQTRKLRSHRGLLTRIAHYRTRDVQIRDWCHIYDSMYLLYNKYVRSMLCLTFS